MQKQVARSVTIFDIIHRNESKMSRYFQRLLIIIWDEAVNYIYFCHIKDIVRNSPQKISRDPIPKACYMYLHTGRVPIIKPNNSK